MSEWQEISSACPPLNEAFLVFVPPACMAVAHYVRSGNRLVLFIDESFGFNEDGEILGATHWMPLPEPPK